MSDIQALYLEITSGQAFDIHDAKQNHAHAIVANTLKLVNKLNTTADDTRKIRDILSEIIGTTIDPSTTIFAPFYINFGRFTKIGKRVFINHACSFLDLGGITIEDDVQIGPRVNIVTENHPLQPDMRKLLLCKPVIIKQNAWIGAGVTILPGVTVGENAVIAAGAVVSKNVAPNTVVAGIPATMIKTL